MELRPVKCQMVFIGLYMVLLTLAQAKNVTEPWAQYLTEFISEVESKAARDSGLSLPKDFLSKAYKLIPNETLDADRPFYKTRRASKFTPDTEKIGHESNFYLYLFELLTKRFGVGRNTAILLLKRTRSHFCQKKTAFCDPRTPYRTIDGSCNNLQNHFWGASFREFNRILPAAYEDGFKEPRGGMSQSRLPNPRKITTTIHYDLINPDPTITNMVPQLGQFLDHDLSLAPEADRHCCTTEQGATDCLPIKIPNDDPFYSKLNEPQTCMAFTRSTPFCFPGPSGQREQFNILTSFVDASQVYGSDHERAEQLRAFRGGRLAVHSQNANVLPTVVEVRESHNKSIPFMGKYLAGDERVNEMPALTTMHILLFREHNRIAGEIERLRPDWTDDLIFEEARRLLIAEWQKVVYGEYLPVILGANTIRRYGLQVDNGFSAYDPAVNPTIYHGFATAAYRFGHTLINGIIQLYRGLQHMGSYQLKDNFFESDQVDRNGYDGYNLILGGLLVQNAQTYDPHITTALTNFVLKERNSEFGSDLIARNVQRGREHGLPPYAQYRRICNLTPLTTWLNKPPEILQDTWNRMRFLYRSPSDIDLFTGGISEVPLEGTYSGATFNCLKAVQFRRLKFGDRFFFTHADQVGSFSAEQLQNIRARTLGDIICENSNVPMTTINVFRTPSESNPQRFCNDPARNALNIELLLKKHSDPNS